MEFYSVLREKDFSSYASAYDAEVGTGEGKAVALQFLDVARTKFLPKTSYIRPMPRVLDGPDAQSIKSLLSYFGACNHQFVTLPPAELVKIDIAYVRNNVIYLSNSSPAKVIYETQRANDRPYTAALVQPVARHTCLSDRSIGKKCIYIGSAGSGNYGHWLVDDLPRAAAILDSSDEYTLLLPSYGNALDQIKADSLSAVFADRSLDIRFLSLDKTYKIKDLWYVTPVSYHPVLKMHSALELVRKAVSNSLSRMDELAPNDKIFVIRGSNSTRALLNLPELLPLLAARGIRLVQPETMSFRDQALTFLNSNTVIGIMGAAMTNTIFCPPSSRVCHLVPNGWVEPFYWDLAATMDHKYYALFGMVGVGSGEPHLSSFSIDPKAFEEMLNAMDL